MKRLALPRSPHSHLTKTLYHTHPLRLMRKIATIRSIWTPFNSCRGSKISGIVISPSLSNTKTMWWRILRRVGFSLKNTSRSINLIRGSTWKVGTATLEWQRLCRPILTESNRPWGMWKFQNLCFNPYRRRNRRSTNIIRQRPCAKNLISSWSQWMQKYRMQT